jgi:hypothetical protein
MVKDVLTYVYAFQNIELNMSLKFGEFLGEERPCEGQTVLNVWKIKYTKQ